MDAELYIVRHWIPKKVWTHLEWPKHRARLRRCAEALPVGGSNVDIGCACGHSTEIMRRVRPSSKWAGADFSRTAIIYARKFFPHIDFSFVDRPAEIKSLGQFDGVVCSEVIEHTENDEELAAALFSITANTLVVTTPCKKVSDPGHVRIYTEESLRALFEVPWERGAVGVEAIDGFFYLTFARSA